MELLTVRETADLLKLSPVTVRRFIAAGRLPAVRVGRAVRVSREAINGLLEPMVPRHLRDDEDEDEEYFEGRPLTLDDALFRIIGIAGGSEMDNGRGDTRPTDVASNKHKYLAEAYADLHDE